jgi:predicted nucleic acid-binding protein
VAEIVRLTNVTLVFVDDVLAREAARLAAELRVRGADSVYIALARELGLPLVTWDVEQLQRAGPVVESYNPSELLGQPPAT